MKGLRGIHLAQVISVHPSAPATTRPDSPPPYAGTLSVKLGDYSTQGGTDEAPMFRVRVLRERAQPAAGVYRLPQEGDWGLVAFFANDGASGVWLGSLDSITRNLIPEELWALDEAAELHHFPSDRYAIYHGDGMEEHAWPDGTLLKITPRKDGQPSNPTYRARRSARKARRKSGEGWATERQPYSPHPQPPVDVVLSHASGAEVRLSADGSLFLSTPAGHSLRLFDDTEQGRDPATGQVTTPHDPARARSALVLEAAGGASIRLEENPAPRVVIDPGPGTVQIAGGPMGAARVGDRVSVTIPAGAVLVNTPAGPGTNPAPIVAEGVIVEGSAKVTVG
ncbi:hypothetical protein [Calidithermus chliarophilus]|uniref:hypothetical protein n=1 Tax=Calidithermus chliarophilus TaxID=52023 RepID=UPI0004191A4A|nr:hypothetical protein [Calidithermus chliarophilus]